MDALDDAPWPPPEPCAGLSWFLPKLEADAAERSACRSALLTTLDVATTLGLLVRALDDETLPEKHRWRLLAALVADPWLKSDAFRIRKDVDFERSVCSELSNGPLLDATAARFYLVLLGRDHADVPWLAMTARSWAPDTRTEKGREAANRAFEEMLNGMVFQGFWSAQEDETVSVGERLPPFPSGLGAPLLVDVHHASEADLARLPGVTKTIASALVGRRPFTALRDLAVPRLSPAKILAMRPWLVGVPLGAPASVDPEHERVVHARLEVAAGLWAIPDERLALAHFRAGRALVPTLELPSARWMAPEKYERAQRLYESTRD